MRAIWRSTFGTLLIAGAIAVTLAVTNGWGWPLLGDARAGIIAVSLLSIASWPLVAMSAPETRWTNLFVVITGILGIGTLGLAIGGLILNSMPELIVVTIMVIAMWLVTTVHHMVEVAPVSGRRATQ